MEKIPTLLWILSQIVNCFGQSQYDLRLVGGSHDGEGRVEIYYNSVWGTVCDDSWNDADAQVVCRQLGFLSTNARAYGSAHFGQGASTVPIWLDEVACSGWEASLSQCSKSAFGSHDCGHYEDAGVSCNVGTFTGLRLMNGGEEWRGRVEVEKNGEWGTVCDHAWDDTDARVVCNQLGFDATEARALGGAYFSQGTGAVYLTQVHCWGSEQQLWDCSHDKINYCTHDTDAGVDCGEPEVPCVDCENEDDNSDKTVIYISVGVCVIFFAIIGIIIAYKHSTTHKRSKNRVAVDPLRAPQPMPVAMPMYMPPPQMTVPLGVPTKDGENVNIPGYGM